ncbi:MAG TPA: penicillin-binding protein 2 [Alphaproteobacteria bacterium]
MKNERDSQLIFSRRALLLGALKLGVFGILVGRMAQLQIVERDRFVSLAEENRVSLQLMAPDRGVIFDRFDVPLAVNVQDFRLLLTAEKTPNIPSALVKINGIVPLTEEDRVRIQNDVKRRRRFIPVLIADQLHWDQVTSLAVALPELPGLSIEEGKARAYPLGVGTAHVIGYVGIANEEEIKKDKDPLLVLPRFQMGKSGLEKYHEAALRGVAGKKQEEVNASGRRVRELQEQAAEPGLALKLTLDAELQLFIQNRLSELHSASAVVMDAYSGAIYAYGSHPAFDPNTFSQGIPSVLWKELLEDKAAPLTNKVIAGQYPPGSTFKMVVALAGLEAGIITPSRHVYCPGHFDLGNSRFHCWSKPGHGSMNVVQALQQSCDVFFYQMGLDIGIERIAVMARRLGLGEVTGIDLPGERSGLIPDPRWKMRRYKQGWHPGETVNSAIGQGMVLTTPLQLAVMAARLVNGGIPVTPYLTQQVGSRETAPPIAQHRLQIRPEHLAIVKEGMDAVVNTPRGTAFGARMKEDGYSFGGKTGTAQVRRISRDERARGFRIEDRPWYEQHHALFVGYAPVEQPRFICSVVVEHGGGGSAVAAPVARDILQETLRRRPDMARHRQPM